MLNDFVKNYLKNQCPQGKQGNFYYSYSIFLTLFIPHVPNKIF
jgi:hypothetical protein